MLDEQSGRHRTQVALNMGPEVLYFVVCSTATTEAGAAKHLHWLSGLQILAAEVKG